VEVLSLSAQVRSATFRSLSVGMLLAFGARANGQGDATNRIKAAFIYNFTKFVQTPSEGAGRPIEIGIENDPDLEGVIAQSLAGKVVDGHPFTIRNVKGEAQMRECQFLVVGETSPSEIRAVLSEVSGSSVVTIGEGDVFARKGGMIGFVEANSRLRFAINLGSAKTSKVVIASEMLSLAITVYR
jgi:hypothetical protein